MKKLINDVLKVVPETLEGFVRLHPDLALLDGYATVIRGDIESFRASGKVAVISGGGAGHEPAHAGYVGRGMLTAAVSGDVFASPSTDAVFAALMAVGTPAGVLMVVKNYTGDRINFGLAAEMARAHGIPVETVVVDDDAALGSAEATAGRRGIAGTVLVHKVAGAAAEAGLSLADVARNAQAAVAGLASMGVGLSPCTLPAAGKANFELGADEIELGLGIHGEAGVERRSIASAATLTGILLDTIIKDRAIATGDEVALLVNNLGGTPTMEMNIVAKNALDHLQGHGIAVDRAYCGTFLTAIEMDGVSLSLMKLDPSLRNALDAPTEAPAWLANARAKQPPLAKAVTVPAGQAEVNADDGRATPAPEAVIAAIRAGCEALLAAEDRLTEMDRHVGDGDIGRSLAQGAEAVLTRLDAMPGYATYAVLRELSLTIRRAMGGTSGPLYAAMALSASNSLKEPHGDASASLAMAFSTAVASVSQLGGAKAGDRTMVDALLPAAEAIAQGGGVAAQLAAAAEAASLAAARTADMMPRRGRSSYIGERALGYPDPGAEAVALWLKAAAASVATKPA
ncbi:MULTISPECIES: dihydroxyacetone kinase subunit DhaL [unclassified Chelatococcus]|uniref:dihydroxyacetone kinase subunit DhaL n=1 Tax=unclassified Chelatococcus TaxID=2638111 RepID=UPI001BCE3DCE|nr:MULTISPECIES: dihydroxyacetone kinase subunit DhaL [unclassified Chelatococcus]CAH1650306.1 Dihydroxyacetone kinase, ATP-dependent [Hyphomicrobiales bacterium]MBS7743324.1 dihydroxyacetone kinase subunit DhaK [Chelatococcus sp. HY11]MBX3541558.1 dihydroxyacetone kinase subunit DhaK [Chelatococcus sp.]MCO5074550.1 dihydroxyacetone kinase subunit DhaL [Chelatococcus sp.]CAH1692572.1 Dihydroxyacetone kinase, ATP-dependent [Hyphomicrobiales bacterium]